MIALMLMIIGLSLSSEQFLTLDNGLNVFRQISINICLSLGMTLVIISGGIDLSVGAVLAFSGAVAAGLIGRAIEIPSLGLAIEITVPGAICAGVLVGLVLGAVNGFVITKFKLPPFIATLGMLSIARGATMLWTGGFPITNLGDSFGFIGTGYWLGIPLPIWISLVLTLAAAVLTIKTPCGRHLYAVGGSESAAHYSGLNVRKIKLTVYTIAGGMSALAGILLSARLDSATPNAGTGYELDCIAAVVIGGTSLQGGRGSIFGSLLGCIIIGVLNNGLLLLEVSPFWQQVIKGVVILLAVAMDRRNLASHA
jgi:ribose transport system permease protein